MEDLHRDWKPHPGQLEVGKKFFGDGNIKTLFLQCGRKYGKTSLAIYALWRHALLNPNSPCYYVTPEMTHGRKLVWTDPRLVSFGGHEYIKSINSNEMIIKFKNGSFIQILGSENFAAANGLRPAFLVYDEFCEFHPRFHETMQPNRIVYNCPLMIIGTPPMQDSRNKEQYTTYAEECKQRKDALWVQQTSYANPYIPKEELDLEKEKLFARGEEYLWYSQYEAKITAGGKHVIFPMLNKQKHVFRHQDIVAEIRRDLRNLEWYCVADPGTTTVMAILFVAVNPYTKKVYFLDEIYESNAKNTSVRLIAPRIYEKTRELYPGSNLSEDWTKIYDEAAAWFSNEMASQFGLHFLPTLKVYNKKEMGISVIKDMLVHETVMISDRCEKLFWEMDQYIADEKGNFPKNHDHLLDAARYFLAAANYTSTEVMEAAQRLGPRNPHELNDFYEGYQKHDDPWKDDDWTTEFD